MILCFLGKTPTLSVGWVLRSVAPDRMSLAVRHPSKGISKYAEFERLPMNENAVVELDEARPQIVFYEELPLSSSPSTSTSQKQENQDNA